MGESVEDCIFRSNSAGDAGAVAGFGSAINCTFIDNYASNDAGAISWVYAENCKFFNNSASHNAGAMCGDSAVNCTFINNYALGDGGATLDVDAVNCNFNTNSAENGGAIHVGSATNCIFTNNYAKLGGAIYCVDAINCTFITNTATEDGGAMYNGSALNCTFINNYAHNNGCIAYNGVFHNHIVVSSDCDGKNYYRTVFLNPTLGVALNPNSNYNYGDKLLISFNDGGFDWGEVDVYVTVSQNGKVISKTKFLPGQNWVVNLDPGTYNVVFSVDPKYNVKSITTKVIVGKMTTQMISSDMSAIYNSNKYLYITLRDSAGRPITGTKVTVSISGKTPTYPITDANGQIKVSTNGLKPGYYSVTITFNGNVKYYSSHKIVKLSVTKANPVITASSKTFSVKTSTKYYYVTLKNHKGTIMKNTKVTLKVNGVTYLATTNNKGVATFKITKLKSKGAYSAVITYGGSSYYNKVTKKVTISVKATPKLYAYAKTFKLSLKTKVYTVTLKTDQSKVMKYTKITLKAYGKVYTAKTNSKGVATFKITNLVKRGIYTVDVKYAGSSYYYAVTKKVKLTAK